MQLAALLALLLLCAPNVAMGSTSDDESMIGLTGMAYVIGIWEPYLKTLNRCENFRLNTTPALFRVWPEEVGHFCCEDKLTPHTMASYVHSEVNGRFLHPIPYYDVGIVESFSPFWRCWKPNQVSQRDITNLVYCEVNDLQRFYVLRFWRDALLKQGLLFSGIPFVLLVEVLVALAAVPQYKLWPSGVSFRSTLREFWGWESTWDVIHLCLLGINGSLLVEGVGHSDPCGWQAVVLYNSGVVYTYLTLLSIISSVVQQIALWNVITTNNHLRSMESKASVGVETPPPKCRVKRHTIEREWQLQRISAQGAVFCIASLHAVFVSVFSRDDFVSWLLGIIIIAQVWSSVVAVAILSKAFEAGSSCYREVREARQRERDAELADNRDDQFFY